MRHGMAWVVVVIGIRALCAAEPGQVIVDFEKAELTGRWVETYEEKGVRFKPAHEPVKSKAKPKLMFFPHLATGRKGILSAMANDPIPVEIQFPSRAKVVTLVLWGSTGCAARVEAVDAGGQVIDSASVETVPGRKSPGDPIPMVELTVKGDLIAAVRFSGPREGEYLAADEVRFTPAAGAAK